LSENSQSVKFGGALGWGRYKPRFFTCNLSYLRNGARYRIGYNGPPIGTISCESSGVVTWSVTSLDPHTVKFMTPSVWGL